MRVPASCAACRSACSKRSSVYGCLLSAVSSYTIACLCELDAADPTILWTSSFQPLTPNNKPRALALSCLPTTSDHLIKLPRLVNSECQACPSRDSISTQSCHSSRSSTHCAHVLRNCMRARARPAKSLLQSGCRETCDFVDGLACKCAEQGQALVLLSAYHCRLCMRPGRHEM